MADDLWPLAVWPQPTQADGEAIVAAKRSLNLPFRAQIVPAVPASPSRVLALRRPPQFLCDYALVRDPQNPDAMRAAVHWVLVPTIDDPRATTLLDTLQAIMPGIREVTDEWLMDQRWEEEAA